MHYWECVDFLADFIVARAQQGDVTIEELVKKLVENVERTIAERAH